MTGATGGVGSLAVSCLSKLGYKVTALTGKDGEHAFLRSLGAADVISRAGLQMGTRPLEKATWAGAVDAVGGDILAWLTKTMNYGGAIANSGLTAGTELHTTVLPFILRGVKLLGIDSVMCPMPRRLEVWRRLATDMKPPQLRSIATEISLDDLPSAFDTLLKGRARGTVRRQSEQVTRCTDGAHGARGHGVHGGAHGASCSISVHPCVLRDLVHRVHPCSVPHLNI